MRSPRARRVPILDPVVHIKKGYAAYDDGIAADAFVKDITGKPYVSQARASRRAGNASSNGRGG